MVFFSNKSRPYHLGAFPLERLGRDPGIVAEELARPRIARRAPETPERGALADAIDKYHGIFDSLRHGEPAAAKGPVPDDLTRRMIDIKGAAFFLNASQVGICVLGANCWLDGVEARPHTHGIVILVELPRTPEHGSLARSLVGTSARAMAEFRAYEIAISIANHIQAMGYAAVAHDARNGDLDLDRLAVLAGLCVRDNDAVSNPYLDGRYAVCAVSTDYELATDLPLKPSAAKRARGVGWWLGVGGASSGLERWRQSGRATHLSKFAMETIKRVERPTTLIIDDEVPRVPKRASFFDRAIHGDLGRKTQRERTRFSFKHPLAAAMVRQIRAMVPHQDGRVAGSKAESTGDAAENTRALKSLSYLLGAELTGICEIPDYAWYSHVDDGKPVVPHHKYAVVMLIDQEFDTMEGASGDDFISGAQSMRAYMRGAVIAGIMGELLRGMGYPARSTACSLAPLL